MQLKLWSAASLASWASRPAAMPASVATKPSMVAMLGRIMPAPLLMPVMVMVLPPSSMRREAALATVSVVMMACAAACQWSVARSACAAGKPAISLSTGRCSRITPVENGSTSRGAQPSRPATASQVARAATMPCSPVAALAMPVLITSARRLPSPARCSRQTVTGAAQQRFWVNTPAARLPGTSSTSVRSRRSFLRMPASAVPRRTPATGNRASGAGVA